MDTPQWQAGQLRLSRYPWSQMTSDRSDWMWGGGVEACWTLPPRSTVWDSTTSIDSLKPGLAVPGWEVPFSFNIIKIFCIFNTLFLRPWVVFHSFILSGVWNQGIDIHINLNQPPSCTPAHTVTSQYEVLMLRTLRRGTASALMCSSIFMRCERGWNLCKKSLKVQISDSFFWDFQWTARIAQESTKAWITPEIRLLLTVIYLHCLCLVGRINESVFCCLCLIEHTDELLSYDE